jgi:hypothetical protein
MKRLDRKRQSWLLHGLMILIIALWLWFLLTLIKGRMVEGKRLHREVWYQQQWCDGQGGIAEWRLPDAARIDCLTDTHAIEFDFADKWAEAIGQALYYASQTGRRAGIVLIIRGDGKDQAYIDRLTGTIQGTCLQIDVWYMVVPIRKGN